MAQTISKHIGEGFAKGELYAALAYDTNDAFGGMRIKQVRFAPATGKIAIEIDGATGAGSMKIHSHNLDSGVEYANEFKGEFLSATGIMDGIAAHYHLAISSSGVMRAITGVAYLDAGKTLSGTSGTDSWISGGLFSCSLAATSVLDGTAVVATGLYGELSVAALATLTAAAHICGVYAQTKLYATISSGESSILLLAHGGTSNVNQAIYVDGGGKTSEFIHFANYTGMVTAGTTQNANVTCDAKIAITIGALGTFYIPAYAGTITLD